MFKRINAKVSFEEVLEFVRNGEDCKLEVYEDGSAYVFPVNAAGYGNAIMSDVLEAFDFEDAGDVDTYKTWLVDCYTVDSEIEKNEIEYAVQVEFM